MRVSCLWLMLASIALPCIAIGALAQDAAAPRARKAHDLESDVPVLPPTFVQLVLVGAHLLGRPRRVPHLVPALAGALALAVAGSAVSVGRHVWSFAAKPSWGPRVPLRPVSQIYRSPGIPT